VRAFVPHLAARPTEEIRLAPGVICCACGCQPDKHGTFVIERAPPKMPSTLNKLLIAIGRLIGQITILALVAGLFIAPITAMLMASFYIASVFAHGAGIFVGFVIFWVLVGLSGWYVTPHVLPQISNAMSALLRSEEEEAVFRSLRKSLEARLAGGRIEAVPEDSIEAFGVLMERYPTAILDTSKLPLPKADMRRVFMDAWLAQTDEKTRTFLEIAFVHLSQFQDDVGDISIDSKLPSDADPRQKSAVLEPYLRFSGAVAKEAEFLRAEFEDFKQRQSST
jgi:hypothetical protein